jgi:hypothetical protein
MARGEIDQRRGNEERADPARALFLQRDRALGDGRQAADARADDNARLLAVLVLLRLPARILDRLDAGGEREDDEIIHLALLFRRHPVIGIEEARRGLPARHLARDLRGQIRDVEGLDAAQARLAVEQPLPRRLHPATKRRDEAQTGDDNPSH